MSLVDKRGLTTIDLDPEETPRPWTLVKPKTEIQYVVLSDSSDDDGEDDDEDLDNEDDNVQRTHSAWLAGFQAGSQIPQPFFDTKNPSGQIMRNRDSSQLHRSLPSHLPPTADLTRVAQPIRDVSKSSLSQRIQATNSKLTRHQSRTALEENTSQPVDAIQLNTAAPSNNIEANEYDLTLFDDYFPEYDFATEAPLQGYRGAYEEPLRLDDDNKSRDMVALHNLDQALGVILEVLPDICDDYVRQKYNERKAQSAQVDADSLLADILSEKSYPKRKVSKKRKRNDVDTEEEEDELLKATVSRTQTATALKVLQTQFTNMPALYIAGVLKVKKSVYETIRTLVTVEKSPHTSQSQLFKPLRKRRRASIDMDDIPDPELKAQFQAAKNKIAKDEEAEASQRRTMEEDAKATERAFELHDVSECQCCFDTFPNAKMVVCDGKTAHTFCTDCLTGHIKAQLDLQKHDIKCMDSSSCTAGFSRSSKQKALDTETFDRWERMEQQNVLRESGLPLDHCPFCDFAAICPPVEEDRELRCQAPECGIVSCRLCKQKSHVPLTCREHKREQGFEERHKIEEEMTKAFLRMCAKCKIPIFKDGGCNKITCSRCGSYICDVCGKDISNEGYKHFGRECPQSDGTSDARRVASRVKAAEEATRKEVLAANPELSAADLEIKDKTRKDKVVSNAALAVLNRLNAPLDDIHLHEAENRAVLTTARERAHAQFALNAANRMAQDHATLLAAQQQARNVRPGRMGMDGAMTPPTPNLNAPAAYNMLPRQTMQPNPGYPFPAYPMGPIAPIGMNTAALPQLPLHMPTPPYLPHTHPQALHFTHITRFPPPWATGSHQYRFGDGHAYNPALQHHQVFNTAIPYPGPLNQNTPPQTPTDQTQVFHPHNGTVMGNHNTNRW